MTAKKTSKKKNVKKAAKKPAAKKAASKSTSKKVGGKKTSKKKIVAEKPTTKKKTSTKKATKKSAGKKASKKKAAVKKVTKKSAKKPAKKAVKKTAKKSAKKTTKKTTKKKAAKKAVKKTAKKTAKKSAKKTVKKTTKKTARKTTKKVVKKSVPKKPARQGAKKTETDVNSTKRLQEQFSAESAQSEIELRKFQAQAEQFGHAGESVSPPKEAPPLPPRELEGDYGETLLVLLVRDPEWVFIYWEIDDATRERFLIPRSGHNGRLMIRYYDVTDTSDAHLQNASRVIDCEVNDFTSSWYQHLPEPNRMWCAEIGVISAEGEFLPICRSNTVHTPRASVAPVSSREKWLRVGEKFSDWKFIETPGGISPEKATRMGLESREHSRDTLHYVLTAQGNVESVAPGTDPENSTPLTREQAELIMRARIGSSGEIWRFNLQSLLGKLGISSDIVLPSSLDLPSSLSMPSSDSLTESDEE